MRIAEQLNIVPEAPCTTDQFRAEGLLKATEIPSLLANPVRA
jgi:hypothetical protein